MKDKMEKRDKWEEIVRSKLENYEVEPEPDDWKAIIGRLSEGKPAVAMKPYRLVYWVAAVILLLLLFDGGYRLWKGQENENSVADISETVFSPANSASYSDSSSASQGREESLSPPAFHQQSVKRKSRELTAKVVYAPSKKETPEYVLTDENSSPSVETHEIVPDKLPEEKLPKDIAFDKSQITDATSLIAEASSMKRGTSVSRRRWAFGMGGGSYSLGNSAVGGGTEGFLPSNLMAYGLDTYTKRSLLENDRPEEKLDVSHKRPISFGMGVSYMLTDRWALQSGVTYTYMKSTWRTEALYQGRVKQHLYFVGIPLGINYKIAEWQRFRFYTGAGIMAEWNVAGSLDTDYYYGNEKMDARHESVRMKEWQWSVNGRTGVSYPLFRYLNAFVEGNASYYFKNGSTVETLRSEKPFYVSLQAGLRLGF